MLTSLFFNRVEFLLNLIDILLKRFVFLRQFKMTCAQVLEYRCIIRCCNRPPRDQPIAPSKQLIARSPVHLSKALTASQKVRPKRVSRKRASRMYLI